MTNEYLPQEVKNMIGKDTPIMWAPVAVDRSLVDHWIETMEDTNPIYYDEDEAKKAGYEKCICPPGMFLALLQPFRWTPKLGPMDWERDSHAKLHFTLKRLLNLPVGIMGATEITYLKPVYVGDHLTVRERLTSVSPEKKTKVGMGHFWNYDWIYANQNGEDVAIQSIVGFGYGRKTE